MLIKKIKGGEAFVIWLYNMGDNTTMDMMLGLAATIALGDPGLNAYGQSVVPDKPVQSTLAIHGLHFSPRLNFC
ncbi:hypothetical protein DPMN_033630 [Dreissena polymorpha]|uniref:Uncharacterized protein n=1 Tax=Dreissena polymorpha TaxID=45954 RepID=A0A9D4M571_DREPO|nr:hypothetical protein DPMN_033630 [Dreissena polymorpha]